MEDGKEPRHSGQIERENETETVKHREPVGGRRGRPRAAGPPEESPRTCEMKTFRTWKELSYGLLGAGVDRRSIGGPPPPPLLLLNHTTLTHSSSPFLSRQKKNKKIRCICCHSGTTHMQRGVKLPGATVITSEWTRRWTTRPRMRLKHTAPPSCPRHLDPVLQESHQRPDDATGVISFILGSVSCRLSLYLHNFSCRYFFCVVQSNISFLLTHLWVGCFLKSRFLSSLSSSCKTLNCGLL